MAEPVVNKAQLKVQVQALEDLQSVPGASAPQFTNDAFNVAFTELFSTTSPPVDRVSYQEYTIGGGGTVDIDLTALLSSQTAINGTGKKVQLLFVKNTSAHSVNVAPGASNAYSPYGAGNDIDIPAGGFNLHYVPDLLADIAAGAKNIRLTGTAADVIKVAIWIG